MHHKRFCPPEHVSVREVCLVFLGPVPAFGRGLPSVYADSVRPRYATSLVISASAEVMAVGLYGKDCRQPGGKTEIRTFDQGARDNYTDALVRGSCRPSGRTKVTITPRNGSPTVLYDGIFKNGEKIEFGGGPGSYEYGVLTLMHVGTRELSGPMMPVDR
jgi:hypothetical protein